MQGFSGASGVLGAFIPQDTVNMLRGQAGMTDKLILPSRTPRLTSAPSGPHCLLDHSQSHLFPRK